MITTLPPQKTEKPKRLRDQFREWLETTGIYIHLAAPAERRIKSPLDA